MSVSWKVEVVGLLVGQLVGVGEEPKIGGSYYRYAHGKKRV